MTNVDSQRIKEIRDNTAKIADAFTRIADVLERMADRKTENCSEKPNNCDTCKHNKLEWYSEVCDGCSKAHSNYEPKDEPQTERSSE